MIKRGFLLLFPPPFELQSHSRVNASGRKSVCEEKVKTGSKTVKVPGKWRKREREQEGESWIELSWISYAFLGREIS